MSSFTSYNNNVEKICKKIPHKLINYIETHLKDGVIHLYIGRKMMMRRHWGVIPYEIYPHNETLISNLHLLVFFQFEADVSFIIYNGTNRILNFSHLNFIVLKV